MKYPSAVSLLALCFALPTWGDPPPGYYDTVDNTTAATLRASLHAIIDDHTRIPYTSSSRDTWDVLEPAQEDPANSSRILDVYGNASFAKEGGGNSFYDREHSWPKSYGFPDDVPSNMPYTDCHALFLCDTNYNSARGNTIYRDVYPTADEYTTVLNNGAGGGSGAYPGNSNWIEGSGSDGSWQTWEGRQGDVARALFYLDVRYEGGTHGGTGVAEPDLILTDEQSLIEASATGSNISVAYMGLLTVLLAWHESDPVDEFERLRNDVVAANQGNRNPFIDHPEWVEAIFGHLAAPPRQAVPFINEFHYDNAGTDTGEFVEVAGPAGLDLTGWSLVAYDGGGAPYSTVELSGLIPNLSNCMGVLDFSFPGLQNGAADGIALVDQFNDVIDFVSYEGTVNASSGPAVGQVSTDCGVSESDATPSGHSLQRAGLGFRPSAFSWQAAQAATRGQLNTGQTFADTCTDTDADGLIDAVETNTGIFVDGSNTGSDPGEPDTDDDGLNDGDEVNLYGSDPNDNDSDADGLPDAWEVNGGLDPASALGDDGPAGDPDADGLTNGEEFAANTSPNAADTDADGTPDGEEIAMGTSPTDNGSTPSPATWVDFGYVGATETGTYAQPFNSLAEGLANVPPQGTIRIRGNSTIASSAETPTINAPVRLEAINGAVRIGGSN